MAKRLGKKAKAIKWAIDNGYRSGIVVSGDTSFKLYPANFVDNEGNVIVNYEGRELAVAEHEIGYVVMS